MGVILKLSADEKLMLGKRHLALPYRAFSDIIFSVDADAKCAS
jgi:hypothetical protein